jgi:CRISPR-associated protein Csb2
MRHAAAEALRQEELAEEFINSYVLGHVEGADPGYRLSFVPLPSIGHQHSDGCIRRVLVAEPPSASGQDAEALDLLGAKFPGWPLTAPGEATPRAYLHSGSGTGSVLDFYVGAGKVWSTVTPVILHGHNTLRRAISLEKTRRLLDQSLAAAGYPVGMVSQVAFQTAPFWPGCDAASRMQVPLHLQRWPRLHIRVEFRAPVPGPVLVGLGRHCGIGVLACTLSR